MEDVMEEIKSIRISELKDFKNHPFHVRQNMELYKKENIEKFRSIIISIERNAAAW